jgi:hypothetical protein
MITLQSFACPACRGTGFVRAPYRLGHPLDDYYEECVQCYGLGHLCVHTLTPTRVPPASHADHESRG